MKLNNGLLKLFLDCAEKAGHVAKIGNKHYAVFTRLELTRHNGEITYKIYSDETLIVEDKLPLEKGDTLTVECGYDDEFLYPIRPEMT
jgi:hypothetical protein